MSNTERWVEHQKRPFSSVIARSNATKQSWTIRLMFREVERYILKNGEPPKISGREEMLENLINSYL
jgi:xylose isomerase